MRRSILCLLLVVAGCVTLSAQQYTGLSGLLHVPSAEMRPEGEARVGGHFLNRAITPGEVFMLNGKKYHTFDYYLAITPFKWVEVSYVCTAFLKNAPGGKTRFKSKDRYFSLKLNPLYEGKYWPAVAVGCNDLFDSRSGVDGNSGELFFANYYLALTKHFGIGVGELGTHLVYRHYRREYNHRWNGVVGGLTFRPSFDRHLRAIVEWTGSEVNVGVDYELLKHVLLQASLLDGKHFSGGLSLYLNLF